MLPRAVRPSGSGASNSLRGTATENVSVEEIATLPDIRQAEAIKTRRGSADPKGCLMTALLYVRKDKQSSLLWGKEPDDALAICNVMCY